MKFKIKLPKDFYDYLVLSMIECYYLLEKNPITKTAEDTDINVEINRLKMQIKNYTNVQNKANTGLFSVAAELESNNMSIKNMLCKFLLNNKF